MSRIEEIKKENKKSLTKFGIILVIAVFVGGIIGWVGSANIMTLQEIADLLEFEYIPMIGYYCFFIIGITMSILSFLLMMSMKKQYQLWDEEDEVVLNQIEKKGAYSLWISSANLITNLGFFAVISGTDIFFSSIYCFVAVALWFVFNSGIIILVQQKVVDMEKEINPEKKGSVYDMKFTEKWLESCDEAEKTQIYQSAWASYRIMSKVYPKVWLFTMLANFFVHVGSFSCIIVSILWLIHLSLYSREGIKITSFEKKHTS